MKNILFRLFTVAFCFVGCTDKFDEFNTDTKHPLEVQGKSLFTNAQKSLVDQVSSTNVNENIFKLCAQYWTETSYIDEANYDLVKRNIPENIYYELYTQVLTDLQEAKNTIEATEVFEAELAVKRNKLQIIDIVMVYTFQRLVDIFGAIPYSEALNSGNVYPKYEKGEDIYTDLLKRLDTAIENIDATKGSFDGADLYYQGDVTKWIKFAYSLKIKLAITMADYDSAKAKTIIEKAEKFAFSNASDNCLLVYQAASPNQNPLYSDLVASGRHDFVAANTLVDALNQNNDPRLYTYFSSPVKFSFRKEKDGSYKDTTFTKEANKVNGVSFVLADGTIEYRTVPFTLSPEKDNGIAYIKGGLYGHYCKYGGHSHVAPIIEDPAFNGILMTYSELMFYMAEAAARGYAVSKSAEEYYNEGIKASFAYWNTDGVEAYLALPGVNYQTAEGTWKEKIAFQSWIASYTRGLVGYTTWRRLDYPIFNIPKNVKTYDEIPVRFTFPINEQTLNTDNYNVISEAIGGDKKSTKLFWDKY